MTEALAKFDQTAKSPLVWDPPQDKRYKLWFAPFDITISGGIKRDCLCLPCAMCCLCCSGTDFIDLAEPDEAFKRMLSAKPQNSRCPESHKGLFWMEGNSASETLLTFEDAVWSADGTQAIKVGLRNWTRDFSCHGCILLHGASASPGVSPGAIGCKPYGLIMSFETSPSGKWMQIAADQSMIYVVQPGDVIKRPDGSVVEDLVAGDWMRVSYSKTLDSTSPIVFQYKVRKIAILDNAGNLVKLPHYERFRKASLESLPHCDCIARCCCGNCLSADKKIANMSYHNRYQTVMFAPPPPGNGLISQVMARV